MYLVPHASPTSTTSPRAYSAAWTYAAQRRAAAAAPHRQTHRQAPAGAQAAGMAHARAAPAVAAHAGVDDDRGRVHQRRHDLLALPGAHGGDRTGRGDG